jgi:chitinase
MIFIKANNLSGAFIWSIDLDDFTGEFCNQSKFPLLYTIKKELDSEIEPPGTSPPELSSTENKQTSFRVNGVCLIFALLMIKVVQFFF